MKKIQINITKISLIRFFMCLLLIATSINVCGQSLSFEVDGLWYSRGAESSNNVFCEGYNISGDVTIPSTVTYEGRTYNVIAITGGTWGENITSVKISDGIIYIENNAFWGCKNLTSVTIPESVIYIGDNAFDGCTALQTVNIPDNVSYIGQFAFSFCEALMSINIPNGITNIHDNTFEYCKSLETITLPESVTKIGNGAFQGCEKLKIINIPKRIKLIDDWAFEGCKSLETIKLPSNLKHIGEFAFYDTGLTSINIPQDVTYIGTSFVSNSGAGGKCSTIHISGIENWMNMNLGDILSSKTLYINNEEIKDLIVPSSIKRIRKNAFYGYKKLKSITLPASVTNIETDAFKWCYNVKDFICQGETPPICADSALFPIPENYATLFVPKGCTSKYQAVEPWNKFKNIVEQEWEQCEPPTITYDNETKKLKFSCATEGATIHYTIKSDDAQSNEEEENVSLLCAASNSNTRSGEGNTEIQLTGVYTITAYAFSNGTYNSGETKAKLYVVKDDFESSDISNTDMTHGIVVSNTGVIISVSGTVGGETIRVYNVAGMLVKECKAHNGNMTINGLRSGNVYIVQIGNIKSKISL